MLLSDVLTLRFAVRRFISNMKAPALLKTAKPGAFRATGSSFRIPELPSVDQVMAEERAAAFAKRSIKTSSKLRGLTMAESQEGLYTLGGKEAAGEDAYAF